MQTRNPTTNEAITAITSRVSDLSIRTHMLEEVFQAQAAKLEQLAQTQETKFEQLMRMMEKMNGSILDLHQRPNPRPDKQPILSNPPPFSQGFGVMVESFGSASTEIELASIDVTDKSDSAIATGVFEDGDLCLDVSTIDSTQAEVTSDIFSTDFSSVFVSSDAMIGVESFGTKFCVSNTISDLCLLRVCGNASVNFPLFCAAHRALSDDFVCLNPPWKPPDSRTHIEFLKLMSLPTPPNYDIEIVINKKDLCIVLKETETKKGVAITLESMLKIDTLDDYVAELEKGVYGLFESFARLYLLNSSVGQTAGKVGDQLFSTDAEWETARQITNFTKYLNEDKLDTMWQGLFLTSLQVHMIYSSPEADWVWSTLLKIKFYDHNRIAGMSACHKLSLKVRFGKPPAKPPDDVVLPDVSYCESSKVSHSYFLWVNMISLLSKEGLVRIKMRNLKLDVNNGMSTPVDGGKDDLIRALVCGYNICKLGPSQKK